MNVVLRRRWEDAAMRPSGGQWLYDDTADDGDVCRAVYTAVSPKQDRAEAKDWVTTSPVHSPSPKS